MQNGSSNFAAEGTRASTSVGYYLANTTSPTFQDITVTNLNVDNVIGIGTGGVVIGTTAPNQESLVIGAGTNGIIELVPGPNEEVTISGQASATGALTAFVGLPYSTALLGSGDVTFQQGEAVKNVSIAGVTTAMTPNARILLTIKGVPQWGPVGDIYVTPALGSFDISISTAPPNPGDTLTVTWLIVAY